MRGREGEDELVRKLVAELFDEPFSRRDGPRVEAFQVCSEQACATVSRLLGQDVHLDLSIGGPTPLA